MNAVITLEMILAADACPEQVALFNQLYPLGFAVVTPESVLAAIVYDINIYWAVERLLRGEFKRSYNAVMAEARKVFNAVMDEADKVFNAALAQAFSDAFNAQCRAEVVA
jgi:hypothetical protein